MYHVKIKVFWGVIQCWLVINFVRSLPEETEGLSETWVMIPDRQAVTSLNLWPSSTKLSKPATCRNIKTLRILPHIVPYDAHKTAVDFPL